MNPNRKATQGRISPGVGLVCFFFVLCTPVVLWLISRKVSGRRGKVFASLEDNPEAFWVWILGFAGIALVLVIGIALTSRRR